MRGLFHMKKSDILYKNSSVGPFLRQFLVGFAKQFKARPDLDVCITLTTGNTVN